MSKPPKTTDTHPSAHPTDLRGKVTDAAGEGWIGVNDRKPSCSRKPGSAGTAVLIWPHFQDMPVAYYGRRQTDAPNFYMFGAVIHDVTHWMPLPDAPSGGSGSGSA